LAPTHLRAALAPTQLRAALAPTRPRKALAPTAHTYPRAHLPAQGFGNAQKVLQCAQGLRKDCDTQRLQCANAAAFGLVANACRKVALIE